EAAALPGGEIDRRQLGEPVEADGGKGGVALSRAAAEKMRPEVEVLLHRQRRLECVLVAKIVDLLADGELPITALKLEPPLPPPRQGEGGGPPPSGGGGHQAPLPPVSQKPKTGEAPPAPPRRGGGGPGGPPPPPPPPPAPLLSPYPPLKTHRRPASIGHVFGP